MKKISSSLLDKKIAVFGLGESGLSVVKLLHKLSLNFFVVSAGKKESWKNFDLIQKFVSRDNCFAEDEASFNNADLIILSPGIPLTHKLLKGFNLDHIWSEIELAATFCDVPIIAITGTNGKTTTTMMVDQLLKTAKIKVFTGGNIGTPFCEYVFQDSDAQMVVLELSSFQLESIKTFHPKIALILNIERAHEERYQNKEEYALSKFNIMKNMTKTDVLILPRGDSYIADFVSKNNKKSVETILVSEKDLPSFNFDKFSMVGKHNYLNLTFTWIVAQKLNISKEIFQKFIDSFEGPHYRIEPILLTKTVKVFNDSKSTNFFSTVTAIHSLKAQYQEPIELILGGKLRSLNSTDKESKAELETIVKSVSKIYLYGESRNWLKSQIEQLNISCEVTIEETLDNVVNKFKAQKKESVVLLFSPAFPSFDLYKNYEERGAHFTKLVQTLLINGK
ncbi:MAG: UDP-N-acetylmuramoyl-L-alanine--D-glutamate ligase [Bacteriovoracaceae bacterium]